MLPPDHSTSRSRCRSGDLTRTAVALDEPAALTEIADKQVKRAIQSVDGVGQVDLGGARAREVHVVVDIEKLNAYMACLSTRFSDAVTKENIETSGGTLDQGKSQLLLRTLGRDRCRRPVQQHPRRDTQPAPPSRSRTSAMPRTRPSGRRAPCGWTTDRQPSLLDVSRAIGENTVRVIAGVKQQIDALRRVIPSTVQMTLLKDDSQFIYASIASIEEHLLWGSLLACIGRDVLHPQRPRGDHLGAGDPGSIVRRSR